MEERRDLIVFAPIDLPCCAVEREDRATFSTEAVRAGWLPVDLTDFASEIFLDRSFSNIRQWYYKELDIKEYCQVNVSSESLYIETSRAELAICSTGIGLLIAHYRLRPSLSGRDAKNIYFDVSRGPFNELWINSHNLIVGEEWLRSHRGRLGEFEGAELLDENRPHWLHGILTLQSPGTDKKLLDKELSEFTNNGKKYQTSHKNRTCYAQFGWEMTAFANRGKHYKFETLKASGGNFVKLILIIGSLWEEVYSLELRAERKLARLDLENENFGVKRKLASLRVFRRAVTRITISVNASNIIMGEGYSQMASVVANQWHLAERKEALEEWTVALETVYQQLRDEENDRKARRFSFLIFILTLFSVIGAISGTLSYLDVGGGTEQLGTLEVVFLPLLVIIFLAFIMLIWDPLKYNCRRLLQRLTVLWRA